MRRVDGELADDADDAPWAVGKFAADANVSIGSTSGFFRGAWCCRDVPPS
jgi:hypothetical protein